MSKKTLLFLISGLIFILGCQHTKNITKIPKFPEDWLGTYTGILEMYTPTKGKYMEIELKLVISETDTIDRWNWQMFYGEFRGQKVTKNYTVYRTADMPNGHYILDENNGILLNRTLMGNTFYDCFDAAGQGLCSITKKENNTIYFEVFSFPKSNRKLSTYAEGEKIDTIVSYQLQYTQKASLKKLK